MSRRSSNLWQDEISIRNDNIRFAFMFVLFTLLAFITTTVLFIFAHNSYHNQSEIFQHHFIHYCILASISCVLFLIFLIGSFVYTTRSLRMLSCKSSSNLSIPLTHTILKPSLSNLVNHKTIIKTKNICYDHCQTDV
ncbi:unnamed protein product [Rotaria sp. Silwood1]|nr:unnamed protein product [Rotaria sp. Silwood1]CAF4596068.1 unnamed protein product [Rotaria sp. Silwood1]CAF4608339.1 unnamed protein product [Rotaria sp. Silwood1]CAF4654534.1 unnamed protein product [Rotaria sp. Silwood1]